MMFGVAIFETVLSALMVIVFVVLIGATEKSMDHDATARGGAIGIFTLGIVTQILGVGMIWLLLR